MKPTHKPTQRARWICAGVALSVTAVAAITLTEHRADIHDDVVAMTPVAPAHTEAQARTAARVAHRAVEVLGKRTDSREVFANPDGTYTENIHEQPIRMMRGGKWVPTDATLVKASNGSVGPRAAVTGLRLSGGGDSDFATIERAGRRYALTWPGPLPVPQLNGSKATYANVLPDVDLVANATVTGFSHVLVIRTAAAARSARLRNITFGVRTHLLRLEASRAGGVAMVDTGSGGMVFETATPRMWDSGPSGNPASVDPAVNAPDGARSANVAVRIGARTLTLTPDARMVADPATRYPIYVDPFTSGKSNESYAMVDSGYPNEEYWKFDGKDNQRIGKCPPDPRSPCNNSDVKRLFYVFPSGFSGKTVLKATFRVTMAQSYDNTARSVSLYRAGSGGARITSATNWNNMPGGEKMSGFVKQDSASPTGEIACQTGSVRNTEFDAAEAVRKNWSKTTFLLRSDNESDYHHAKRFCHNGVLSVTYNRPPKQPTIGNMSMSPGGVCVTGGQPFVSSLPRLKAVLADPDTEDAEPLKAEFTVTWTPPGGSAQSKTWKMPNDLGNGETFTYNLADANTGVPKLPENVVTRWQVRAWDGPSAPGPWSPQCAFVLDKSKPVGPDIDSAEYLPGDAADHTADCQEDAVWHPGVGRYGTFTFDSLSPDVTEYQYGFDTNPSPTRILKPDALGGPVSLTWLPQDNKPYILSVLAVDRAGKQSDISSCTFRVDEGTGPVAEWRLDDNAGSTTATDATGRFAAVAGTDVQFGVPGPGGAADGAVHLTGAEASYLAPTGSAPADTSKPLTVSAWVRLTDDTRYQTLLSQDGTGESALQIGYNPDNKKWFVRTPITDVQSLGSWSVSGPVAVKDKWTHLTVTLNPVAQTMAIAVDGAVASSSARRFAWTGHGGFQIGRRFLRTGLYGDGFAGDISDVRIYDRLLTAAEVAALPKQITTRLAYWDLDGMTPVLGQAPLVGRLAGFGTTTELEPDLELRAYGGVEHFRRLAPDEPDYDPFAPSPLVGDGHLILDGATGYAATPGPVALTSTSFSVTARVQPATDCSKQAMTVLSQPGTHSSGFELGCTPNGSDAQWRVTVPRTDTNGAAVLEVSGVNARPDPAATSGQFLTVTYDAAYQKLILYVDGQQIGEATDVPATWMAGGALQIGRSMVDSTFKRYFGGAVDEVRVYSGVLDPDTIQQLNSITPVPGL